MAALAPVLATAQESRYRPPPHFLSGDKADQAEGARVLQDFRAAGIAGTYWLRFELRVMPRKAPERTVHGELLGSRAADGPVTRLTLAPADANAAEQRWLIQGGPQAAAYRWDAAANAGVRVDEAGLFAPMAGTELTLFDLQMPFLYWADEIYEGVANVRGRPAHSFVFYPPPAVAAARPGLTGVRVLLDTQFEALLQAELLGAKGETERTITILDLKKAGEQWLVKSIDLRDARTRDKTRFEVTAAALSLELPAATFTPAGLAQPQPEPPPSLQQRL
ncbi:MAG TPA: hypothetical protein VHD61_16310 [Lacunisphaera sp.]|nr:hypothetical protein [Lacunisphaera sp.]